MDILNVMKERRSIRKFNTLPVEREEIEKIVEAGRWAPSGGNSQSVHFTVLLNPDFRSRLREKVKEAFSAMELTEGMYKSIQNSIRASKTGNYNFDYEAPVLIVVSNRKNYPNAMADSACALENMMLEASVLGIGSCWINQLHWLDENEALREMLRDCGIGEDETICGALAVGRSDFSPKHVERVGMPVSWY